VEGTCESCGRDGEQLRAVHRVYVTPDSWDSEGKTTRLEEVEWWCFACCTHYPHESVEE